MSKILVVEDEKGYREQLQTILSWEGYDVRTAANGREAIDIGARFRPDVLVTDWMLRDQIHGFHVIGALRLVHDSFRAILITAFASQDLKAEAGTRRVFQFVEKPFDLDYFQEVIQAAIAARRYGTTVIAGRGHRNQSRRADSLRQYGGLRNALRNTERSERPNLGRPLPCRPDPRSRFRNRKMAGRFSRWSRDACLGTPFSTAGERRDLDRGAETASCFTRANQQLMDMLLGVREGKLARWPFDKRVLVVDDDQLQRQLAVTQLEGAGTAAMPPKATTRRYVCSPKMKGSDSSCSTTTCREWIPPGSPFD